MLLMCSVCALALVHVGNSSVHPTELDGGIDGYLEVRTTCGQTPAYLRMRMHMQSQNVRMRTPHTFTLASAPVPTGAVTQ